MNVQIKFHLNIHKFVFMKVDNKDILINVHKNFQQKHLTKHP